MSAYGVMRNIDMFPEQPPPEYLSTDGVDGLPDDLFNALPDSEKQ